MSQATTATLLNRKARMRRPLRRLWMRIRRPIVDRILHLDDSPHRIAFGVFLGFVVGWTPTMGAQIFIYLALAYALRANRISGLVPVLLTNPITAVPVYLLNWRVGRFLLHPGGLSEAQIASQKDAIAAFIEQVSPSNILTAEFWETAGATFRSFGLELIVGCLVVGVACGLAGYIATYYGVVGYRRRRARKRATLASAHAGTLAS